MNDQPTSDRKPSSVMSMTIRWTARVVLLLFFYLLAGPWIALFLCAASDNFMNTDHPLGMGLEWFLYPAWQVAERSGLYGKYFWDVLAPLGG